MTHPTQAPPPRLITIRFSHFCEKARWALDFAGLEYREQSHVPMFSWRATFGSGGQRTVPVLVTGERTLSDSTDILRWVDAQGRAPALFPSGPEGAQVERLEELFDKRLGPATRRLAYFHLVRQPDVLRRMLESAGPAWEARATRLLFPLIRAAMVRGMRIDERSAQRSRQALDEVLEEVARLLADGRRYLAGERFSAADLTFASLLTPLLWPEALRQTMPLRPEELAPELVALVDYVRATPGGQFASRLYAEERSRASRSPSATSAGLGPTG